MAVTITPQTGVCNTDRRRVCHAPAIVLLAYPGGYNLRACRKHGEPLVGAEKIDIALGIKKAPTPAEGRRIGMALAAQAADAVDAAWKERMMDAILACAQAKPDFICDDVWEWAKPEDRPPTWKKPKALGNVMIRAAKSGIIHKTDRSKTSENAARHRSPVPVWESLVYQHVDPDQ